MDINLVRAFSLIIQTGSVTQTARVLGVSQPAVSTQMARLEEAVGFQLFNRVGNRLKPTADAMAFHRESKHAISVIDGLERVAGEIRSGGIGTLVVAAHPSAGVALLPPALARFSTNRPGTRVELMVRNSDEVRSLFPSRKVDIGIAEMPIDPSGLYVEKHALKCVAVLPRHHPLGRHRVLTPKELDGENFIIVSSQRATYLRIRDVFAEYKARLNIIGEFEMFASICGFVANGAGVSIVDRASALHFRELGLTVVDFEPRIEYDFAVFHSTNQELPTLARPFLEALRDRISELSYG